LNLLYDSVGPGHRFASSSAKVCGRASRLLAELLLIGKEGRNLGAPRLSLRRVLEAGHTKGMITSVQSY
jgi:hypothetical protein